MVKTWDRDLIRLQRHSNHRKKSISIPRGKIREALGEYIWTNWKVHLSSTMQEEDVKAKIRSIFAAPMKKNHQFPFTFLQCNGGGSKTLTAPQTSIHFQWTAD